MSIPSGEIIESGWVIASGEGNFYDQEDQVPKFYAGINRNYPSPSGYESGVLYTYPENSGSYEQITGGSGDITGIKDSLFAPPRDLSHSNEPYYANLGVFFPYIHHYPKWIPDPTSIFSSEKIAVPFKVDYSLTFSPSNGYNRYSERDVDYDAVDSSGNPLFAEEIGKPPRKFG